MNTKSTIEKQVTEVLCAWLANNPEFADTGFYEAQRSATFEVPAVVVKCMSLSEVAPGSGVFEASVMVTVESSIDEETMDVDATHAQRFASVEEALEMREAFAEAVSSESLHVYGYEIDVSGNDDPEHRNFADQVMLKMSVQR